MARRPPKTRKRALEQAWESLSKAIRLEHSDEHGYCTCVTCRGVSMWNDNMHAGHFLAGRKESYLYDERGIFPQCGHCNYSHFGGSVYNVVHNKERATMLYTIHMMEYHHPIGRDVIEDLMRKKDQESKTHTIDELVAMRDAYDERIRAAKTTRGVPQTERQD